jgi:hypothetical protein
MLMTRWFQTILVSLWMSWAGTAYADPPPEQEAIFISHVALVTDWVVGPDAKQSLIEQFKHLLRVHGYQTDACVETKEAWKQVISQAEGKIPYHEIDQKLVAAQVCAVPSTATRAYSARLTLVYDEVLKQRQAICTSCRSTITRSSTAPTGTRRAPRTPGTS